MYKVEVIIPFTMETQMHAKCRAKLHVALYRARCGAYSFYAIDDARTQTWPCILHFSFLMKFTLLSLIRFMSDDLTHFQVLNSIIRIIMSLFIMASCTNMTTSPVVKSSPKILTILSLGWYHRQNCIYYSIVGKNHLF